LGANMNPLSLSVLAGVFCGAALSGCGSNPAPDPTKPPDSALMQAWNNHFAAFGAGVAAQDEQDDATKKTKTDAALEMILKDYDANSTVRVWTHGVSQEKPSEYKTLADIEGFFRGLFGELAGCHPPGEDANKLQARTEVDEVGLQVFLVWTCIDADYLRATDTFIFDKEDSRIIRDQNIVVKKKDQQTARAGEKADSLVQFRRLQSQTLEAAWKNHADAFAEGIAACGKETCESDPLNAALDKIMKDYNADSVVRVFQFDANTSKTVDQIPFVEHSGIDAIEGFFKVTFESFTKAGGFKALLDEQVEATPQVFLVWSATENNYEEATDTFIYKVVDGNYMIDRQNIALYKGEE